jgi:hypothetical protein
VDEKDLQEERITIRLGAIRADAEEARRVIAMNPLELASYRREWDRRTTRMMAEDESFSESDLPLLWQRFFQDLARRIGLYERLSSLPADEARRELA